MNKIKPFEVRPLDLQAIRKGINLTLREMGIKIGCYSRDVDCGTFVATRVSEWEKGHRPVPDYVFRAAAYITLDYWSDDRHSVAREKVAEVDFYYGTLLSKPFGALLCLEHELGKSRKAEHRRQLVEIRKLRRMQQHVIEKLFGVKMGYVFAAEPGGFNEEAAGEVL